MQDRASTEETGLDAVGWYGKLPALGDFASRRLAGEFIDAWDDWLARGIAAWREAAPDGWLDEYLAGPSWRFVLMPGVLPGRCGRMAWVGVLMPSVDRVGRYFPLTLAQPVSPLPADGATTEVLLRWLQRLDDAAVDALQDDWNIDQLDAALARCGRWPPAELPDDAATAGIDLQAHADGATLWLGPDADGRTRLHTARGLPGGKAFRALLAGAPDDRSTTPPSTTADFHEH